MRVVLDTNVLLSGLINPHGLPAQLIDAWRAGKFELITSRDQLLEFGEVARRPKLRRYIVRARVGRFINDLRELAVVYVDLPQLDRSPDPGDDFLLAMAEASDADDLATGDKSGVLDLRVHGRTQIVTVRRLVQILNV